MHPAARVETRRRRRALRTMGAPLLRFVTPGDVRDLKNRVDPIVQALDAQTMSCSTLPAAVATSWRAFSSQWRSYFNEDDSWLHTAAQMDQGEAYESDVANWQKIFASSCTPTAPLLTPTSPSTPDEWLPAVPWIAGAVIVGGLVWTFGPAIRAWSKRRFA